MYMSCAERTHLFLKNATHNGIIIKTKKCLHLQNIIIKFNLSLFLHVVNLKKLVNHIIFCKILYVFISVFNEI